MKFNFYIISFLILFSIQSQAQYTPKRMSMKLGETQKKGILTGIQGVVGTTDAGFFILRTKTKGVAPYGIGINTKAILYLDYYLNSLKLRRTIEIKDIPMTVLNKAKNKSYEFIVQDAKQNLWLFYSDVKSNKSQLYKKKLDPTTFKFGAPVLVREHDIPEKKLDRRSSYKSTTSKDGKHILVYSSVHNASASEAHLYVEVFDENLEPEWTNDYVVPKYKSGTFEASKVIFQRNKIWKTLTANDVLVNISNKGVVHFMDRAKNKLQKDDIRNLVYAFHKGSSEAVVRLLDYQRNILEINVDHDLDANMQMTGLYTNDRKSRTVDGVAFITLDPLSLQSIVEKYVPIEGEHKKAFVVPTKANSSKKSEKKAVAKSKKKYERKKNTDISSNNNIIGVYYNDDNGVTLCTEYFDMRTTTSFDSEGRSTSRTIYTLGNLQFIKLSENAEIDWAKSYYKSQIGSTSGIYGVSHMMVDGIIYFLYNDISNKSLKLGNVQPDGNTGSRVITSLGKKGRLEGYSFAPSMTTKLSDDSYIAFATKIFKQRIMKLTFRD